MLRGARNYIWHDQCDCVEVVSLVLRLVLMLLMVFTLGLAMTQLVIRDDAPTALRPPAAVAASVPALNVHDEHARKTLPRILAPAETRLLRVSRFTTRALLSLILLSAACFSMQHYGYQERPRTRCEEQFTRSLFVFNKKDLSGAILGLMSRYILINCIRVWIYIG